MAPKKNENDFSQSFNCIGRFIKDVAKFLVGKVSLITSSPAAHAYEAYWTPFDKNSNDTSITNQQNGKHTTIN